MPRRPRRRARLRCILCDGRIRPTDATREYASATATDIAHEDCADELDFALEVGGCDRTKYLASLRSSYRHDDTEEATMR